MIIDQYGVCNIDLYTSNELCTHVHINTQMYNSLVRAYIYKCIYTYTYMCVWYIYVYIKLHTQTIENTPSLFQVTKKQPHIKP